MRELGGKTLWKMLRKDPFSQKNSNFKIPLKGRFENR